MYGHADEQMVYCFSRFGWYELVVALKSFLCIWTAIYSIDILCLENREIKMSDIDKGRIQDAIDESASGIVALSSCVDQLAAICSAVVSALKNGNKILTAGNGGSAAEALHMAEELVGRFRGNRISLPAVCLAADTTALTCIGNDYGFDHVFSRQVEGLGKDGDLLVLFSTSGNAGNLEFALKTANEKGMSVIAILGRSGGRIAGRADYELLAPGTCTERIQEVHQLVLHIVLDAVELAFE